MVLDVEMNIYKKNKSVPFLVNMQCPVVSRPYSLFRLKQGLRPVPGKLLRRVAFFLSTDQDSEQLAYVAGNFKKKQRYLLVLFFLFLRKSP
ncbi:MAG: hypothetical protein D3925_02000 [Candidatus Electrothrix sp. AR5]|nr:hypothetical protein [Candidatus Electrothrix sp. AR5]